MRFLINDKSENGKVANFKPHMQHSKQINSIWTWERNFHVRNALDAATSKCSSRKWKNETFKKIQDLDEVMNRVTGHMCLQL
jgi:hypothetical protein